MSIQKPIKICVQKLDSGDQKTHDHIHTQNKHNAQKLSAAFWVKKLWPIPSNITYAFVSKSTPKILRNKSETFKNIKNPIDPLQKEVDSMSVKDAIKKIVNERIQPMVSGSITFKYIEDPVKANIRISFDPKGGAWSLVGTDCLKETINPTMNFGWFDVTTTIHEFCHVLGLIHEHQNPGNKNKESAIKKYKMPDGNNCNVSDNGIKWNIPKVLSWAQSTQGWDDETTCNNIIKKYDVNQLNGSNYDPCSIMLYFFSADLLVSGKGTQQNNRLSGTDVKYICSQYNVPDSDKIYESFYGTSMKDNINTCSSLQSNTSYNYIPSLPSLNISFSHLIMFILVSCIGVISIKTIKNMFPNLF